MDRTKELTHFSRADIWLFISMAGYFLMNGAQLWETAIIIPAWTEAPPASLLFFQGPYGIDLKNFWIVVHSMHEVTFLLAIIFNWRVPGRRTPLLLLFAIHIGIRAWTLIYFDPTIIWFQQLDPATTIHPDLVEKAAQWRDLNVLRVGLFFMVNIALVFLFRHRSASHAR